jgi:hypothetical protein
MIDTAVSMHTVECDSVVPPTKTLGLDSIPYASADRFPFLTLDRHPLSVCCHRDESMIIVKH